MKILRYLFIITLILIAFGIGFWFFMAGSFAAVFSSIYQDIQDGSFTSEINSNQKSPSSNTKEDRRPATTSAEKAPISIDRLTLDEVLCQLGDPIQVQTNESSQWILYYEGPFISHYDESRFGRYAAIYLDEPTEQRLDVIFYYDEIPNYNEIVEILPEDLTRLRYNSVPGTERELIGEFGDWTVAHSRGSNKKRVVYSKPSCFRNKPFKGFAVTIENHNVISAKSIQSHERLARAVYDLRTYRRDDKTYRPSSSFRSYASQAIQRDGPIDTLLTYIVALEYGEYKYVKDSLAKYILDTDLRRGLSSATNYHEHINVDTLEYKIVNVEDDKMSIDLRYTITNGEKVSSHYNLEKEDGEWRIRWFDTDEPPLTPNEKAMIQKLSSGPIHIPTEVDANKIHYTEQKPIANSPQEACINYLLLMENGEKAIANYYFSKETKKFSRRHSLIPYSTKHGPIETSSLQYQLEEIKDGNYRVYYTANWEDGASTVGRCTTRIENGKWKLK